MEPERIYNTVRGMLVVTKNICGMAGIGSPMKLLLLAHGIDYIDSKSKHRKDSLNWG